MPGVICKKLLYDTIKIGKGHNMNVRGYPLYASSTGIVAQLIFCTRGGEGVLIHTNLKGVLVGIDKHLIPRYNKNSMMGMILSKASAGTKKFECYGTMQIVGQSMSLTIAAMQFSRHFKR